MASVYSDKRKLALDILQQIDAAIDRIGQRVRSIRSVDDFLMTPEGMEKLESVCMLLLAIGEGLKNVDKHTRGELLPLYPSVPWKEIKGMRDVIAHHYFDIDAEEIFYILSQELLPLQKGVRFLIDHLKNDGTDECL